jgi:hypothetical protein
LHDPKGKILSRAFSGASIECWSFFENLLRCAISGGNRLSNPRFVLTEWGKFDNFKKFAQKCWRTQSSNNQQRNQVRGHLFARAGLDPKGRRLGGPLSRIFDN